MKFDGTAEVWAPGGPESDRKPDAAHDWPRTQGGWDAVTAAAEALDVDRGSEFRRYLSRPIGELWGRRNTTEDTQGVARIAPAASGSLLAATSEPPTVGLTNNATLARLVGRRLAAAIPEEHIAALASERTELVQKEFVDGLSRAEQIRLTRIDWELDRIEDAAIGDQLDFLEHVAATTRRLAEEVQDMNARLAHLKRRR